MQGGAGLGIPAWAVESGRNMHRRNILRRGFDAAQPTIRNVGTTYKVDAGRMDAWTNQASKMRRPRSMALGGLRTIQDAIRIQRDAKRLQQFGGQQYYTNAVASGVSRFPGAFPRQYYQRVYNQLPPPEEAQQVVAAQQPAAAPPVAVPPVVAQQAPAEQTLTPEEYRRALGEARTVPRRRRTARRVMRRVRRTTRRLRRA